MTTRIESRATSFQCEQIIFGVKVQFEKKNTLKMLDYATKNDLKACKNIACN